MIGHELRSSPASRDGRWPWYLAVDVSHSMRGNGFMLEGLCLRFWILEDAGVDDTTRLLAMIEFAGTLGSWRRWAC